MKKKFISVTLALVIAVSGALVPVLGTMQQVKAAVKISKEKMVIKVGEKKKLTLKGKATKVKWTSSKKTVASVSSDGTVEGKKPGTAIITAKVGKKSLTCTVSVKKTGKSEDASPAFKKTKNISLITKTNEEGEKSHIAYSYDEKNNIIKRVSSEPDGSKHIETNNNIYDDSGKKIGHTREIKETDGNGVIVRYEYSENYSKKTEFVIIRESYWNGSKGGDGNYEFLGYRNEKDSYKNITKHEVYSKASLEDEMEIESTTTYKYTYDKSGLPTNLEVKVSGKDRNSTSKYVFGYEYDKKTGYVTERVCSEDGKKKGDYEVIEYTYFKDSDKVSKKVSYSMFDGKKTDVNTEEYDKAGNLTKDVYGDTCYEYAYDAKGNLTKEECTYGVDGYLYEYDSNGNTIHSEDKSGDKYDGSLDTWDYKYNSAGVLIYEYGVYNSWMDGEVISKEEVTDTYDDYGMPLSHSQISYGWEGNIAGKCETTYTQNRDSDGCPISADVKEIFCEYDVETGEKYDDEIRTWTEEYFWADLGKSSADIP